MSTQSNRNGGFGCKSCGVAPRAGRSHRGMGLLEVMVSLAICSLLLVACATAFTASASAINNNDAFFRCAQAGRVTVDQILAEIRNCDSMDMSVANTIKIVRAAKGPATQEYYLAPNEVSRSFVYDPVKKRITLQITYIASQSPVYELTGNVASCSFGPADMGSDYNGLSMPVRVPITVTITTGGNSVLLAGSAVPRRATTMRY